MPTIFITGSSTGLGRATALLFASRGWKVIATMRDPARETELRAVPDITLLALDVTQPAQIDSTVQAALKLGPVDVVFNNAGYGLAGPFEATTDDQLRAQIDTNLMGVLRVTRAFVPALRERGSGTIITTTSIGGLVTFPFNSVYHATKWALEGWSESLAFELAPLGIQVKTVAPGGMKTDFAGRSLVVTSHPAYAGPLAKVLNVFSDPARQATGSTAPEIAQLVFEAATDGRDRVTYVGGAGAQQLYAMRLSAGIDAFRKTVAAMFLGG